MNGVWILTYELNEYGQDGDYYLAVFKEKPDWRDLERALMHHPWFTLPEDEEYRQALLAHILEGGGRRGTEWVWFNLRLEEFA